MTSTTIRYNLEGEQKGGEHPDSRSKRTTMFDINVLKLNSMVSRCKKLPSTVLRLHIYPWISDDYNNIGLSLRKGYWRIKLNWGAKFNSSQICYICFCQ